MAYYESHSCGDCCGLSPIPPIVEIAELNFLFCLSHLQGKLIDGTIFDSSFERGDPIAFELGVGQVIKGEY